LEASVSNGAFDVKSDRFQGRKRGGLKQALQHAGDPALGELRRQIHDRQEQIAQLEFELSDTRADLARFEREYNIRIGPLEDQLRDLEDELVRARHKAARRAQWGDRVDGEDAPVDVEEQFRKTWTSTGKAEKAPPPKEVDPVTKEELRAIFRQLAKRFHPDLVTDPVEKRRREKIMAEVNEAYASQDIKTLRMLSDRPDQPESPVHKSREQIMAEMHAEVIRLDGVIVTLQRTLQQLINSHAVQLMLEKTIAAQSGRDLLGEMAADLRAEIARLEVEIVALRH
jgi:hypothetical protein